MIKRAGVPPSDAAAFRRDLYAGGIFILDPTPASTALVAAVRRDIDAALGEGGPAREAQFRLTGDDFFARAGRLRKLFYTEPRFHEAARAVMAECGCDPARQAFDPIRLRVVTHAGHADPAAAPIYHGHRDTWYANPQAMITWWIPLHDVTEAETFVFFPEWFARAAANDSERFDYGEWVREDRARKVGWQKADTGRTAVYPRLLEDVGAAQRLGVSCRAAQILLFSGQHLHRTIPNTTGQTRFSLDFRSVDLDDHAAGHGAPNVDNRSRGSGLPDYVHPAPVGGPAV